MAKKRTVSKRTVVRKAAKEQRPPRVVVNTARLPKPLADRLAAAAESDGFMIGVWKLQEGGTDAFDFYLTWPDYPYDLMLRSLKEFEKHVLAMKPPR